VIYPVPAQDNYIYIKSHLNAIGYIEVYDIMGHVVLKKHIAASQGKIDISILSSGIYIIKSQDVFSRFIVK